MTAIVYLDGVPLDQPTYLIRGEDELQASQDASGSGSINGSALIEDSLGTARLRGWQQFVIDETACTSAPRLQTSYIGQRTYARGPTHDGGTYRTGASRVIQAELYDLNVLLSTRLITGGDAVRPAESDTDRIAWLLASAYLDGLVYDSAGWVSTTGLMFDAANYHGMYPAEVLQDMCSTYDQIFFVQWDQTNRKPSLFFDFPDATTYTSTMSISNVLSDVSGGGGLVVAPFIDAQLTADPSEVYSNVRYTYSGGVVYLNRQATADEFFTDNGFLRRGVQVGLDKIGKATTATVFGNRYLDAVANERLAITCTVQLPATQVNLIDAGMRLQVKFTHLPDYGFDSYTYTRVQGRSVTQARLEPDALYNVTLTLALTGIHSAPSGGSGGVPHQPPASGSIVQTGCGHNLGSSVDLVFPATITAGNLLVAWVVSRGTSTSLAPPDGSWTTVADVMLDTAGNPNNSPAAMYYKIADSTEAGQTTLQFTSSNGSSRPKILGWELADLGPATHHVSFTQTTGNSGSFPALTVDGAGICIIGVGSGSDNPAPASISTTDHFYIEGGDGFFQTALGADKLTTTAGTQTFTYAWTGSGGENQSDGVAAFFPATSSSGDPAGQGQPEANDTLTPAPDSSTTVFNTTSGAGFASDSLRVWLNGSELEGNGVDFTETDNAAGEVTFVNAPPTGANVQIYYLGI